MTRHRVFALAVGVALGLIVSLGGGCARHVHHHHASAPARKVVVLEKEHEDRRIVVVHSRPAAERHCWKHAGHWHCRAR